MEDKENKLKKPQLANIEDEELLTQWFKEDPNTEDVKRIAVKVISQESTILMNTIKQRLNRVGVIPINRNIAFNICLNLMLEYNIKENLNLKFEELKNGSN